MGALEGILVVSVEQALAAPLCTSRLADSGARVIKIERASGDFARGYDGAAKGESSYFVWINQGKESVALDIKKADDKSLLEALIAKADVFVQNLAPGALQRAGFGSDRLRRSHPRLVTCDISGYGNSRELRGAKAYDLLVQAESGLIGISGGPGELGRIGVSICDIGAGMTAHAGILEALYKRERTGRGSGFEVSLFDVAADWMTVPLIHQLYGVGAPARQGLRHPSIAPYGAYRCLDGGDILISVQNEREWCTFCAEVLKAAELTADPLLCTNNDRVKNRAYLDGKIGTIVKTIDTQTMKSRLTEASIAFGQVNSVAQLPSHPALTMKTVRTSEEKPLDVPASPFRWADPVSAQRKKAPRCGEHSEAVRAEFLSLEARP